ncbi:hypothetical protein AXX17_AT3G29620 [Arabidopsis thaliana]|uniref:Uncharacterized protein n=1 Tax=Arabidopsis thaliana TaxID=3702 RepID=A0A178V6Q2_ARATH|nr:hypothetical protein AXX17_AT3G29620 [Arabidopsis thaliana]
MLADMDKFLENKCLCVCPVIILPKSREYGRPIILLVHPAKRYFKLQRTLDKGFQDEEVFSCKEDLKTIQRYGD